MLLNSLKTLFVMSCVLFAQSVQANVCSSPPINSPATISGIVNTYYAATGNAPAGTTTLGLGASSGVGESIGAGDLVLVIQMQDATINTANTAAYGDGSTGRGQTAINSTGLYEFASVASGTGTSITLVDGLQNSYNNSPATLLDGQKTYQIIKVPVYDTVTAVGTLTAPPWDGAKGGVFVIDVANTFIGNGQTVDVDGLGFRGGAYRATGFNTNATERFYYRDNFTNNVSTGNRYRHASKGEGIAGTPQFIYNGTAVVDTNGGSNADGYPSGDYGRGAPGNAGGGGNEWGNGNDSGGGGGANFAIGGQGGAGWNLDPVTQNVGGLGGGAFPSTMSRIVMGGGGGAGLANNANSPHGGNGGGIIILRTNRVSGNATLTADGADGTDAPTNDGAGGAGAGGSVVTIATSGLGGLSGTADGGIGGDAWPGTGGANGAHGPGGGGSGGYVIYSAGAGVPSISVDSGESGITTTGALKFGSTAGTSGSVTSGDLVYPCAVDLSVTKTNSSTTYTPGETSVYTITVSNAGPADAIAASLSDLVPVGLTIDSVSVGGVDCGSLASCSITGQQITTGLDVAAGSSVDILVTVTYSTDSNGY